jgi:N utilization substance protein B
MSHSKEKSLKVGNRRKGRELCVQALYQYERGNLDTDRIKSLDWLAGSRNPSSRALDYFRTLFEGTLEHLEKIDEIIHQYIQKKEVKKIFPIDFAILRFAAFSLLYEKDVPAVIIINEAVEIAKTYSGIDAHKFINGVLDGIRKKLMEQSQRAD